MSTALDEWGVVAGFPALIDDMHVHPLFVAEAEVQHLRDTWMRYARVSERQVVGRSKLLEDVDELRPFLQTDIQLNIRLWRDGAATVAKHVVACPVLGDCGERRDRSREQQCDGRERHGTAWQDWSLDGELRATNLLSGR